MCPDTVAGRADDAIAILAAFNSPEVEIIGMTTIFGNIATPSATQNAIRLRELAGQEQVSLAVTHSTASCIINITYDKQSPCQRSCIIDIT